MKVLVLGGTRFTGKAVVQRLAAAEHDVTVISRRKNQHYDGVKYETAERLAGLERLRGTKFDACLDFICYDAECVTTVFENINPGHYAIVSTTWLPRLEFSEPRTPEILPVTRDYLNGKATAEKEIYRFRAKGKETAIVRLPITLGQSDHTGRGRFYLDRIVDGRGLILVNGGQNIAQIAWCEDVATVLCRWLEAGLVEDHILWEALPDAGATVRAILMELGGENKTEFAEISADVLQKRLPKYLELEPLFRETSIPITEHNIFNAVDIRPTLRQTWLSTLSASNSGYQNPPTRDAEISLIEEMTRD